MTKPDTDTGWTDERLREIVKHISDAAIELAFVRHDLTSDEVDVDEDATVKERVAANEEFAERVKEDVLNCLTGDDFGCLDPEELDESNCELLWLRKQLASTPSDFEQLIRLRGACEAAEQRLADNERWRNQEEIASEVPESYRQAFKARAQVTRNTLDQIREALAHTGEQS